jgi:hypothetical protein
MADGDEPAETTGAGWKSMTCDGLTGLRESGRRFFKNTDLRKKT